VLKTLLLEETVATIERLSKILEITPKDMAKVEAMSRAGTAIQPESMIEAEVKTITPDEPKKRAKVTARR
jgi:hypothetical protein